MKRDVVSIGEATLESESKRARSASCQLDLATDNDVAEDASGFGVDSGGRLFINLFSCFLR